MLLERRITVRIAVGVEGEVHFIARRFFARANWRRWRWPAQFFCRLPGCAEFLPQQRARRHLSRRIFFLQRLELALQLPQREGNLHLRRDKKCLNEQHRPEKKQHSCQQQNQAQPRPAFACRIGENERRQGPWRDVVHEPVSRSAPQIRKSHSFFPIGRSTFGVGRWRL